MPNAIPNQPTKAQVVAFEVLLGEREYQTETHGGSPAPTLVDFANLLIEYTDKLAVDVTVDPTLSGASPAGGPLKRLREIAAIALHAMEVYGIQPRENHVPASAGITGTANIIAKPDTTVPVKSAASISAAPAAAPAHVRPPRDPQGGRAAPLPPALTATPPPTTSAAPAAPQSHDAIQLPHHPATETHGKK